MVSENEKIHSSNVCGGLALSGEGQSSEVERGCPGQDDGKPRSEASGCRLVLRFYVPSLRRLHGRRPNLALRRSKIALKRLSAGGQPLKSYFLSS